MYQTDPGAKILLRAPGSNLDNLGRLRLPMAMLCPCPEVCGFCSQVLINRNNDRHWVSRRRPEASVLTAPQHSRKSAIRWGKKAKKLHACVSASERHLAEVPCSMSTIGIAWHCQCRLSPASFYPARMYLEATQVYRGLSATPVGRGPDAWTSLAGFDRLWWSEPRRMLVLVIKCSLLSSACNPHDHDSNHAAKQP